MISKLIQSNMWWFMAVKQVIFISSHFSNFCCTMPETFVAEDPVTCDGYITSFIYDSKQRFVELTLFLLIWSTFLRRTICLLISNFRCQSIKQRFAFSTAQFVTSYFLCNLLFVFGCLCFVTFKNIPRFVGFDCEWARKGKISLIQIATWDHVILIR